ncbi:MAG TPA: hypothetical protein PKE57_13325 [Cellvibrionaceae bacterium]|nr:hypothetical protein [Cellvibrionaceae bacterium]HMW48583.1 hypothetical protein [Cellvibrionaceae bacterium]HMW72059.1 hypothetical protein [Cellvibrionaceae bacterium]HMY39830.1 hypothetical protein [Marinagarivorans sp.]HNG59171.1 hypothetical protein [Cellvibrionaceae bacterium]
MINSVMQQGSVGMQQSQARMLTNAQEIASSAKSSPQQAQAADVAPVKAVERAPSVEEALLDLQQNRQLFDASAKVFAAGSQSLGRLLDTSA